MNINGEKWLNYKGNELFQSIPPFLDRQALPGGFFLWKKKKEKRHLRECLSRDWVFLPLGEDPIWVSFRYFDNQLPIFFRFMTGEYVWDEAWMNLLFHQGLNMVVSNAAWYE